MAIHDIIVSITIEYGGNHIQKSQVIAIYALVIAASLVSVIAVLTIQWNLQRTGSIKGVGLGVYWDPECANATSLLDFGLLEPGSSKNFSLYLKNEGDLDLNLSMTLRNWNPANAADYLTLTWNRERQQISPEGVIGCVITLSVSEDIERISAFSLDIIISGIS